MFANLIFPPFKWQPASECKGRGGGRERERQRRRREPVTCFRGERKEHSQELGLKYFPFTADSEERASVCVCVCGNECLLTVCMFDLTSAKRTALVCGPRLPVVEIEGGNLRARERRRRQREREQSWICRS